MVVPADLRPLRVAALVDDLHPPAWAARVLRELTGGDADRAHATSDDPALVVLAVVAVRRPAVPAPQRPRWLRAYDAVDARVARRIADPLAPVDIRALLEGVTVIELAGPPRPGDPAHGATTCNAQPGGPMTRGSPGGSGGSNEHHGHPELGGPGSHHDLQRPDEDTIRRLAAFDLDAVVDLGTAGHAAGLTSVARFGVWTLVCGEPHPHLPPGTWEVIARAPLTRSRLIADLPGGARRVLYESSSATDPTSARRNRAHAYAKAAAFVRRTLRDLAAGERTASSRTGAAARPDAHRAAPSGTDRADAQQTIRNATTATTAASTTGIAPAPTATSASIAGIVPAPSTGIAPAPTAPGAPTTTAAVISTAAAATPIPAATPLLLTRFAASVLRDRLQRAAWRKQWILAYGIDPSASDEPAHDLSRLTRIVPPADRFWADPFVVRHGDGWVILLEERIFARPHAHIAALPVARDGTLGEVVPVLERGYHLSYPFVFMWNGAWWMIPESAHNRTVELWRATDFPLRWTLERVLLADLEAADATLIEHAGAWWMFCTVAEPGASKDDELHVFHAPSPLGPWRPHARNPIQSTARGARPAGRPFRAGGSWVRPAQDGSRGYGGAIVLWRIDQLDAANYRETELRHVAPDWDPALVGLHTINAAAGLTVIDLRILRRRWPRGAQP